MLWHMLSAAQGAPRFFTRHWQPQVHAMLLASTAFHALQTTALVRLLDDLARGGQRDRYDLGGLLPP